MNCKFYHLIIGIGRRLAFKWISINSFLSVASFFMMFLCCFVVAFKIFFFISAKLFPLLGVLMTGQKHLGSKSFYRTLLFSFCCSGTLVKASKASFIRYFDCYSIRMRSWISMASIALEPGWIPHFSSTSASNAVPSLNCPIVRPTPSSSFVRPIKVIFGQNCQKVYCLLIHSVSLETSVEETICWQIFENWIQLRTENCG